MEGCSRGGLDPQLQNLMLIAFPILVNLNHFRLLRVVGKGAFGKVRIVERKDTGLTFALKYIRKEEGGLS
jgi:serine/threonine kinase 32